MDKIASNAQLSNQDLRKIAAFSCAVALASPVIGASKEQVKKATDSFISGMEKAAARHEKIVAMIRDHVRPAAHA